MSDIYTLCELKYKYDSLSIPDKLMYSAQFNYCEGFINVLNDIKKHDCFLYSGICIRRILDNNNYSLMKYFINYLFEKNIFNSSNISKLNIDTWLSEIIRYGKNIEFLKLFSKYASKEQKSSVLVDAVYNKRIEILKFLIDNGADIYYNYHNAFNIAVRYKIYDMILLFIKYGFNSDYILDEDVKKEINILLRSEKFKKICLDLKN